MRINLKSVSTNGETVLHSETLYEPYVWEQVAMKPFSGEMEKIMKNPLKSSVNTLSLNMPARISARYLILEMTFASQPNIGS